MRAAPRAPILLACAYSWPIAKVSPVMRWRPYFRACRESCSSPSRHRCTMSPTGCATIALTSSSSTIDSSRSTSHVLAGTGPTRAPVRVIVVGVDDDPAFARARRRLGAEAWIAKDRADEDLPTTPGERHDAPTASATTPPTAARAAITAAAALVPGRARRLVATVHAPPPTLGRGAVARIALPDSVIRAGIAADAGPSGGGASAGARSRRSGMAPAMCAEPPELVRRWLEAYVRRSADGLVGLAHPDIVIRPFRRVPERDYRGHSGVRVDRRRTGLALGDDHAVHRRAPGRSRQDDRRWPTGRRRRTDRVHVPRRGLRRADRDGACLQPIVSVRASFSERTLLEPVGVVDEARAAALTGTSGEREIRRGTRHRGVQRAHV